MLILLIILFIFGISTILFSKSAGTLNPGKINVISYTYYIFMLQSFTGAALIALGYDEHYTLKYLLNKEKTCTITIIVIAVIAIFLPLLILIWEKIFKVNIKLQYQWYLEKKVDIDRQNDNIFFEFFLGISLFCIFMLLGLLSKIGYVPIWKLFHASSEFNFATERSRIGSLFFINAYFTNIFVLLMIPLLSYVSFAYLLSTKKKKWLIMTSILFIASIIVKTYKFEKSSLIFYLAAFVLILIYFKGGIKLIYMVFTVGALGSLIVLFYFYTGFTGTLFDIYNGPLGRTLFTEVGTLAYTFDLFPAVFDFLQGRSFSPTILKFLGIDSGKYLRSAKLTMAFYGSEGVYNGSAGVMNSLFVGEAYANWGYKGIILGLIWVSLVLACVIILILKLKKTPATITLLAVLTIRFGTMFEGGFCDFVYNIDVIITILFIIFIYLVFESQGKIQQNVTEKIEKTERSIKEWFGQLKKN